MSHTATLTARPKRRKAGAASRATYTPPSKTANELLRDIAEGDRPPTAGELRTFERLLCWDASEVRRQLRRMGNVLRLEAIAGSAIDRQAARHQAEVAAHVYEIEGPKVREQLEKLESKLRTLATDKRITANRVQAQADALAKLQSMQQPKHPTATK